MLKSQKPLNKQKKKIHHSHYAVRPVFLLLPFLLLTAIDLPLEFHGRGFLGKYLNSDTTRYNMDASIDLHCTLINYKSLSFFIRYQDDLDMAEQKGGVSLDPRYDHYYIIAGFNYTISGFFFAPYFVHDCIHDIDVEVEGTPVFNRFRMQFASESYHYSNRLNHWPRFKWSIEVGFYPHWDYHGWDINAGADYKYDMIVKPLFNILNKGNFGINVNPIFHSIKGDTCYYHKHTLHFTTYYLTNNIHQIGVGLDYNIWHNDPIKNPDKLWILSIFVAF